MKALFIGGTGIISTAIVKRLVNELNWEVWMINRGNRNSVVPEGVHQIIADMKNPDVICPPFVENTLGKLIEYDQKHRSDYIGNKPFRQVNKFVKFFKNFFNLHIVPGIHKHLQDIEPLTLHKFIHKM